MNTISEPVEPWNNEPDYARWTDPATGLRCVIIRNLHMKHLCGYVQVPHSNLRDRLVRYQRQVGGKNPLRPSKAWRRMATNHSEVSRLDVHGGVTWSGKIHRPSGGQERGFWIGFDCGHAWDIVPMLRPMIETGVYRDFAYVRGEVERLAKQIRERL